MMASVVSTSVIAGYYIKVFLWKQLAFYLSLSLSVISISLAQHCCKKYTYPIN